MFNTFKTKHNLVLAPWSASPPPKKENFWVRLCDDMHIQVVPTKVYRQFLKSSMKGEELRFRRSLAG